MYFTPDDWQKTKEVYEKWWAGKLQRPLIQAAVCSCWRQQIQKSTCDDFSKTPEEIVEQMDANIQNTTYYGDSFPFVNWDFFGPGCIASYLGSTVITDTQFDMAWFRPLPGEPELSSVHLSLDLRNPWFNRCKDLYAAGAKKWKGKVLMGMTDIGGELDILASLLGTERLLCALIEEPEEVDRLLDEIHTVWLQVYRAFNEILAENNAGYADWAGLFSATPSYTQQCDFSYMISAKMFRRFAAPYLEATSRELTHTLYHLDGKGALTHLDAILSMPQIQAVQWQPGDGAGFGYLWMDVYRRIRTAGKNLEYIGPAEDFIRITEEIGANGFYYPTGFANTAERNAFFDRFKTAGEPDYRR